VHRVQALKYAMAGNDDRLGAVVPGVLEPDRNAGPALSSAGLLRERRRPGPRSRQAETWRPRITAAGAGVSHVAKG
jgi:hypothetical protein